MLTLTIIVIFFNAQDLCNRNWYRVDNLGRRKMYLWLGVYFWGMIRMIIGNAWASYCDSHFLNLDLIQFRKLWAKSVLPRSKSVRKVVERPLKRQKQH